MEGVIGVKKLYVVSEKTRTREDMTHYYDSWCTLYEKDSASARYHGPTIVANALSGLFPEARENVRILDVAAGTGLVGEQLSKHGFVQIDALDASQGMLNEAKAKNVYQTMIYAYFDEKQLDIAADTYDAIVICGGCMNNHLPCDCLREVVRLVKPGGFFVMSTRPFLLSTPEEYKDRFEPLMDKIENEGKWKRLRKEIVSRYIYDEDGIIFVYQIL